MIDFTIGADPEFCCVSPASRLLTATNQLQCSCHDEEETYTETFGADGCGTIFEVRPGPSKDPLKVVANIHQAFVSRIINNPKFGQFTWKAGSYKHGFALGGHIHFGIGQTTRNSFTNHVLVLSQYVGALTLLLEDKDEARKRRNEGGYGGWDDYRVQDHGFEYRTPSSWLTSPYIASSVLCLAKAVMSEILNNPAFAGKFKNSDGSNNYYINGDHIHNADVNGVMKKFPQIWDDITKFQLYPKYKKHLDLIHQLITTNCNWFPKGSMNEAWGLCQIDPDCLKANHIQKMTMNEIWDNYNKR